MKPKKKLAEADWAKVFRLRCLSKQGHQLAEADEVLVKAAYKEDQKRYAAMEKDVFNATVPFGSTVRRK